MGEHFLQNGYSSAPGPNAAQMLNNTYNTLANGVWAQLLLQTDYKPLLDSIDSTSAVANLPDMQTYLRQSRRGSRQMRDLHKAANDHLWRLAS